MTSITDVPYEDIKLFLTKNNVRISSNEKNNYDTVLKMIKAGKGTNHPDSLIDWIIAYNLLNDKIHVNRYSVTEINLANERELQELGELLGVSDSVDIKQSVLNILRYLKKLDNILFNKDIDSYIFSLAQSIDEQKILSADYSEIIEIFRKNKTLRKFIHDNMEKIMFDYTFDGADPESSLGDNALAEISAFIIDLFNNERISVSGRSVENCF